jgi:arabinofuranosyltransferase
MRTLVITPADNEVGPRSPVRAILMIVPVACFVAAGWAHRWIADDGFIYLRVVRQLAAGNGPVFNSGERVEAFTSPLWTFVLWSADLVTPFRLEWIAVVLGLAGSTAGLVAAIVGARTLTREVDSEALLVPVGAIVFAALLPVWVFETSGLETGLTFAWEGVCLALLARWTRSDRSTLRTRDAVVLGLGWLVRPELVVFSVLFFAVVLAGQWQHDRARERMRLFVAMFAVPLIYELFRMGYYGSLVANTAIAKEASALRWQRGWDYFVDSVRPYWLWVPVLALLAGGWLPLLRALTERRRADAAEARVPKAERPGAEGARHRRGLLVASAYLCGAVLSALYVIAVGGDYMHARLLLPALFAFCAPVAVVPLARRNLVAFIAVPWALAAALILRPPDIGPAPPVGASTLSTTFWGKVTVTQYGWGPDGPGRRWYRGPSLYAQDRPVRRRYMRVDAPVARGVPLPTAVLRSVGLPSFAMGPRLHVLDVYGLADSLTAHLERANGAAPKRLPGHEKPLPSVWVAARLTPASWHANAREFPNTSEPLIAPTRGEQFAHQVAWARAAMRCPAIADLTRAGSGELGIHRYLSNVLGAFRNTRLRIPPDPEAAYDKFCGPETPAQVRAVDVTRSRSNAGVPGTPPGVPSAVVEGSTGSSVPTRRTGRASRARSSLTGVDPRAPPV